MKRLRAEIEELKHQLTEPSTKEITLRFDVPDLLDPHAIVSIKPRFVRHKERILYRVVQVKAINEDDEVHYVATLEKI